MSIYAARINLTGQKLKDLSRGYLDEMAAIKDTMASTIKYSATQDVLFDELMKSDGLPVESAYYQRQLLMMANLIVTSTAVIDQQITHAKITLAMIEDFHNMFLSTEDNETIAYLEPTARRKKLETAITERLKLGQLLDEQERRHRAGLNERYNTEVNFCVFEW